MAEDTVAGTAKALKELAEAVPVYQDAVQPTAKELGSALAPAGHEIGHAVTAAAKGVNIALAPLHLMVWGWKMLETHVFPAVAKKLEGKLERLVTPNPIVAVPALEALRYAGAEPTLRDMYVNLLATSMDPETALKAHPGFVEIIRQMTPDEAKLLRWLRQQNGVSFGQFGQTIDSQLIEKLGTPAGCEHLTLVHGYVDNLERLGLVDHTSNATRVGAGYTVAMAVRNEVQFDIGGIMHFVALTAFGKQFCAACMD